MKKHPIEAKICAYLDSLDHQPTATEFFDHFKSEPRLVEFLVISSLLIDYEAKGLILENFTYCKDSEKIEFLIEEYSAYPELAQMFIPRNIITASIYKDLKELDLASEIIDYLLSSNDKGYYQDVYSIKELLFEGSINLELLNCPMNSQQLVSYIEECVAQGKFNSLSDKLNALNAENFMFYRLNKYVSLMQLTEAQEIISKYSEKRSLELNPINSFNTYLSGHLEPDSVHMKLNLLALKNLVQGIESTKITIKTDIGSILKGFGSEVVKDHLTEVITDYLIDKIPLAKEIKLGKNLFQAFVSNMFEMADVSFLIKELGYHRDNILELKTSVKDYYINHFLAGEFETFFAENNLEYIPGEMNPVFERLYVSFIQSVNTILTPELEEQIMSGTQYASYDLETKKFLMVCYHY